MVDIINHVDYLGCIETKTQLRRIKKMNKKERSAYWRSFSKAKKKHGESITPLFILQMNYLAGEASDKCIELSYQNYGYLLKDVTKTLRYKHKLDWSHSRKNSAADIKGMTLGMILDTTPYDVIEYASINRDPEIGFYKTRCSIKALLVTIAHEMAHVLQSEITHQVMLDTWHPRNSKGREKQYRQDHRDVWLSPKPHGKEWREIYRLFRTELLKDKYVQLMKKAIDEKIVMIG